DAYRAWMRERWLGLLRGCGVPHAHHAAVLESIETKRASWRMRLYPEVPEVLRALKDRGLRLVVCSNWDWDLDRQLELAGVAEFVDERVCSAWVGARKPHRRMFDAA